MSGGSPKAYGTYVYDYAANSNRLSRILLNGGELERYTYDNAGRLTQRIHARDGTTTYLFDDRGLLSEIHRPGLDILYSYDALGVRSAKSVNGVTTYYLTAQLFGYSRNLMELSSGLDIQTSRLFAGPQLLKEEPVASDPSQDRYLLHDGLVGSLTHALDINGNITAEAHYDAFGQRSGSAARGYGYSGEEQDTSTGLIYLRARYYDPRLGRFISADPYWGRLEEPVTQNRYIYVRNNPLLYTDPSGLKDYSINETEGILAEARRQSFREAFVNHGGGGKYDFSTGSKYNDTFSLATGTYNSAEFGNYLAGYTGAHMGGFAGYLGVRVAGIAYDIHDYRGKTDFDQGSAPYIQEGAARGQLDREMGYGNNPFSCMR